MQRLNVSASRGSITIMTAWAVDPRGAGTGTPYRDERPNLVCTLCGEAISTCATCGRHFQSGQPIVPDGCIALRTDPDAIRARNPPPLTWWERFLITAHLRAAPAPITKDETLWKTVPDRPHRCRNCNEDRT